MFSFPRPPLSFKIETLVILHLLGDPVDTLKHLQIKLSACQKTAEEWQRDLQGRRQFEDEDEGEDEDEFDRAWKALSLITDAYEEWGKGQEAKSCLKELLYVF